jgi:general stress protein YciG
MRLTKLQREALREMARAGGYARAKALSPERRRKIGRQGALARLRNIERKAAQERSSS